MAKFRKKPIVVEAVQYIPGITCTDVAELLDDIHDEEECWEDAEYGVYSLNGLVWAEPGDWIIKDPMGDVWPCKPEVFQNSYELVEND